MKKRGEKRKRIALKTKRKITKKKLAAEVLIALLSVVFAVSGLMLLQNLLEYKEGADKYNAIKNAAVTAPAMDAAQGGYLTVDYDALIGANSDYMGWIDVPDTNISYPVVFAEDYTEYIHKGFDGGYLYAGTIFADYNCEADWTSLNTVLYGHHMKDGSMFAHLSKYYGKEFYNAHKAVHVYTKENIYVYEIFSVYKATAADESYTVSFDSDEAFIKWADGVAQKNVFGGGAAVSAYDRILTLSTCKSGDENARTVVFALLKEVIER